MFDDIIIDRTKETKENYKKDLKKRIDDILDYFKLEPDNKENRQNLSIVLKKLLEEEKNLNKIKNYVVDITEKNIKVNVDV